MYSVWRKNRDGERLLGYAENQTIASLLIEADMEDSDEAGCEWMMRREDTNSQFTMHNSQLSNGPEKLYHEDEKQYSGLLEEE